MVRIQRIVALTILTLLGLTAGIDAVPAIRPVTPRPSVDDPGKGFPRRLLAISVNNYAYANPVSYGGDKDGGPRSFHKLMGQLAELMHVPSEQVTIVSDRAPPPLPPTKELIEQAVTKFVDTSRDQDRIILLFVGHAVEVDGVAYLVPLLGEPDRKETLIPLAWLFQKLAGCKARQKLLVLDVCRFDRGRREERGAVAKMSKTLEAALQKAPRGIQILAACSADQYSWELDHPAKDDPKNAIKGGIFLNTISQVHDLGGLPDVQQAPEKSLPVAELHKAMLARTKAIATMFLKADQSPRLFGVEVPSKLKFDPNAPPPPTIKIELTDVFRLGVVDQSVVKDVLALAVQAPPIGGAAKELPIAFDSLPPYPNDLMAYQDDGKDTELRKAVREAVATLVKQRTVLQETLAPLPTDVLKKATVLKQTQARQEQLALIIRELEKEAETLRDLEDQRAREPKRWQANYDYVLARLLLGSAELREYSAMLGKVRKEELPSLEKGVHVGYKLVAQDKITDSDARERVGQSRKLLERIAAQHRGTPWYPIARQQLAAKLGLGWEAY
ncbi:MAG: caspase family protein [Gemmataceae bacterium]|nr:caspase family protein [Gemmataceae bacterium]